MFYLFAIFSSVAYALQNTLLVRYARRVDSLSLAFYRNISFAVTLLPLLLAGKSGDFAFALSHWHVFALAGAIGAVSVACQFASYGEIAVGVSIALGAAISAIWTTVLGVLFFGEIPGIAAILSIVCVCFGCMLLGFFRQDLHHLGNRFTRGVLLATFGAVASATTKFIFSSLSRDADPFVMGYFWETSIAAGAVLLLSLRRPVYGRGVGKINMRTMGLIALCALPTLPGTAFFGLASRAGPVALLGAVGTLSLVLSSLLSHWLYGEKLSRGQWLSLTVVMLGIIGIKFA